MPRPLPAQPASAKIPVKNPCLTVQFNSLEQFWWFTKIAGL